MSDASISDASFVRAHYAFQKGGVWTWAAMCLPIAAALLLGAISLIWPSAIPITYQYYAIGTFAVIDACIAYAGVWKCRQFPYVFEAVVATTNLIGVGLLLYCELSTDCNTLRTTGVYMFAVSLTIEIVLWSARMLSLIGGGDFPLKAYTSTDAEREKLHASSVNSIYA